MANSADHDAAGGPPAAVDGFGARLRLWRQRRRLSQLDLAAGAEVSQRHLSFLESGRAAPSRAMVLRLAEELGLPLREQNAFLLLAGFAPAFGERRMDDPTFAAARAAVDTILTGHEPHPALAVDRHWSLLAANRAVAPLLAGAPPVMLQPPVNVLRLSLHPDGLGPRVLNWREWRAHVLARLGRQVDASADPVLAALAEEIAGYPAPPGARPHRGGRPVGAEIATPFEVAAGDERLSFVTATTVFGTALDVTLAEVAVESFFPADARTAEAMRRLVARGGGPT